MPTTPSLSESTKTWAKIGILSFGGPAAQIALMHREIVNDKKWISENQFLNALNFCMLLPGPEAMQLATYAGWRINGVLGGLIAGLLFVLPGAFIIALLATIYAFFGNVPIVNALFLGVKATVVVIVIEALLRVSKKALQLNAHYWIAVFAFIAIFFLNLPYPLIILTAAAIGFFEKNQSNEVALAPLQPFIQTLRTIGIWLIIWWLPVLIIDWVFELSFLSQIAFFFSKLAVVTFGGAYAVLAYMAQDVVTAKEWLSAGQMMDGLGLAETTPGPLILVTEFVGFMAGFKEAGIAMAFAAATLTLWVTFAPCFLWIFAGAPYIEWIGAQPRLRSALTYVTAAVVGVILNLSIWFAIHVFFASVHKIEFGPITILNPELTSLNWVVVSLSILSAFLLLRRHWNVIYVLFTCALLACFSLLF